MTMADSSPPFKKTRGSLGQPQANDKTPTRKELAHKKEMITLEGQELKYTAPSEGLTVWQKGWTTKEVIKSSQKPAPFTQIFGESINTIHSGIQLRHKFKLHVPTGYVHTVTFWTTIYKESFGKQSTLHIPPDLKKKIKALALRLASTPDTIFHSTNWKDKNLCADAISTVWAAAQHVLGTWRWAQSIPPSHEDDKPKEASLPATPNKEDAMEETPPPDESGDVPSDDVDETSTKSSKSKGITFDPATLDKDKNDIKIISPKNHRYITKNQTYSYQGL